MDESTDTRDQSSLTVSLFPLPNVVLFPRAVLPLHIFEERYKTMVAHALAGDRRIAMVLLKPGWERNYHDRAMIAPVVCVGRILNAEKLADGKYNLLLQGELRGKIVRELPHSLYRIAQVVVMSPNTVVPIHLENERQRLIGLFSGGVLANTNVGRQMRQILHSSLSTPEAVDVIAFNFFDDVAFKQSLLADEDVIVRVGRVLAALDKTLPVLMAGMN